MAWAAGDGEPTAGHGTARPRRPGAARLGPMPTVRLRAPLKDLAGGASDVRLPGSTVGEVLRSLEREHPKTLGWVLDETGRVRRHVNVFVNGERSDEHVQVGPDDVIHVLPSITGGAR